MAAVKRSRSSLVGAVTKINDKVKAMKSDEAAEVRLINPKDLARYLTSLEKTEAGFSQSLDDAQDFAPEGEAEDAFQDEEQIASDNFNSTLSILRDKIEHLITLRNTLTKVGILSKDLKTLEDLLATKPDGNHTGFRPAIEDTIDQLRNSWEEEGIPSGHPIQDELEACSQKLANLRSDAAGTRARMDLLLWMPQSPPYLSEQREIERNYLPLTFQPSREMYYTGLHSGSNSHHQSIPRKTCQIQPS